MTQGSPERTGQQPLAIGDYLDGRPFEDSDVYVRLQRTMPAAYVVTVNHGFVVHTLTRSYPNLVDGYRNAWWVCELLRCGFTVQELSVLATLDPNA